MMGGVRQGWNNWINRRVPATRAIQLSQRSIFIFPTLQGLVFIALAVLILIAAINFQNNLLYGLTFTLLGMFVVSILHTYSNLSGLMLQASKSEACFAGKDAVFHVTLSRSGHRDYEGIQLVWPKSATQPENANRSSWASLNHGSETDVAMYFKTDRRGICRPGRFKVQTTYPLGLLRAWTWVDLQFGTVVYPMPIEAASWKPLAKPETQNGAGEILGSDDFYGLRDYASGDSLRQVAWKSYAKTEQLQTKQFYDSLDQRVWLDWDYLPDLAPELRLSGLCYWALEAERGHTAYGLRLPGVLVAPARGESHLADVLRVLALFGVEEAQLEEVL